MRTYVLLFVSIALGALGQVTMKWGTMKVAAVDGEGIRGLLFKYFTNPQILLGLVLYALSAVLWILAISKVNLSFAYPMVALGYIIVFGISHFAFGESISLLRLIGLITIVAGVAMIAKS